VEKKASGKAHGESYPSADETTIVDSRQDSEEGDRCSEDDPEMKCAAILVNLRALIEEAKANIQIIQAKTKPAVDDDGEKDNQDIQKLNTMIDEATFTIEVLDSKVSSSGKEKRLRLLFDDAEYVISQVMSAPMSHIVESGSHNIKKAISCTEEGFFLEQSKRDTDLDTNEIDVMDASRGDITRESVLEGLTEEVRLLTGLGDTSKQVATEESAIKESMEIVKPENIATTITKTNEEVDDRNFLVLMADMVEEFGGMLAEDSAKLAERASFPQWCWY
jgi:hypothetical protein